jgi:hypothetical protein
LIVLLFLYNFWGFFFALGKDGLNGINGINGVDGKDGTDGAQGLIGQTGPQGPIGMFKNVIRVEISSVIFGNV